MPKMVAETERRLLETAAARAHHDARVREPKTLTRPAGRAAFGCRSHAVQKIVTLCVLGRFQATLGLYGEADFSHQTTMPGGLFCSSQPSALMQIKQLPKLVQRILAFDRDEATETPLLQRCRSASGNHRPVPSNSHPMPSIAELLNPKSISLMFM
jgi:hypothetical protein